MKPPICVACYKDFRTNITEGGLVEFQHTQKDKENFEKSKRMHHICHPPATEWFCSEHYEKAKKLTHLTLVEALKILRGKEE